MRELKARRRKMLRVFGKVKASIRSVRPNPSGRTAPGRTCGLAGEVTKKCSQKNGASDHNRWSIRQISVALKRLFLPLSGFGNAGWSRLSALRWTVARPDPRVPEMTDHFLAGLLNPANASP